MPVPPHAQEMMTLTDHAAVIIAGDRIRLRLWNDDDSHQQLLWPSYDDPFHMLWHLSPLSGGFEISQRWSWAIEDMQGRMIGRLSLRELAERPMRARLGIALSAPHVGHGLGSEAMRVFLNACFQRFGFELIVLDVAAFNRRAVRCYERLAFQTVAWEWRPAGDHSAQRLLRQPRYRDLTQYFRTDAQGLWVAFQQMELSAQDWALHAPAKLSTAEYSSAS